MPAGARLQQRYTIEDLKHLLMPRNAWHPFPKAEDRAELKDLLGFPLNRRRKDYITGHAEACLNAPWPSLPATLYMDFGRTGTRKNFQAPYLERRRRLAALTLAELFEDEARFLDEIANGIWALCDEATWCVPAHFRTSRDDDPLPLQDMEHVDLYACETARILAETCYMLESRLNTLSPALVERVRRQTFKRVIEPVEEHAELYSFMSSSNWNPWRTSNILWSALVHMEDADRLARLVHKLMGFIDHFLNGYARKWPDGGCPEGPGYWNKAAGKLIMFLELLHDRSGGRIDIYDDALVREMCLFISRVHLAGPYFACFADAAPRPGLSNARVYRCGERLGSDELKNLALSALHDWNDEGPADVTLREYDFSALLLDICWIPADARPGKIAKMLEVWLPDNQIAVWRECAEPHKGLVVAAKAGSNHDPHNHNDVGQFIVMHDVHPVIVDIGAPEYRRETFSPARYDIWPINAGAHNVPRVDGHMQLAGTREIRRAAKNVTFQREDDATVLTMELASCYAAEAGIKSLTRVLRFGRMPAAHFIVTDTYEMNNAPPLIEVPLYAGVPCETDGASGVVFRPAGRDIHMVFDPELVEVSIAAVDITDPNVRDNWPGGLWRILLRHRGSATRGSYELRFNLIQ